MCDTRHCARVIFTAGATGCAGIDSASSRLGKQLWVQAKVRRPRGKYTFLPINVVFDTQAGGSDCTSLSFFKSLVAWGESRFFYSTGMEWDALHAT